MSAFVTTFAEWAIKSIVLLMTALARGLREELPIRLEVFRWKCELAELRCSLDLVCFISG